LTFAITVAVAIAATRSDPPWRLTALALGAALMTAAAALLVAMANALDVASTRSGVGRVISTADAGAREC
jgi:hypothetical protein